MLSNPSPFLRHLQQCNTANPAATRAPFRLAGVAAGWITPALFSRLTQAGLGSAADGFNLPDPAALEQLGEQLAAEGFIPRIMSCSMSQPMWTAPPLPA